MDGYRLTILIDTVQVIGSTIVETAKDIIDLWTENQEDEDAQPKEEK